MMNGNSVFFFSAEAQCRKVLKIIVIAPQILQSLRVRQFCSRRKVRGLREEAAGKAKAADLEP
jgi:hypothetical protein